MCIKLVYVRTVLAVYGPSTSHTIAGCAVVSLLVVAPIVVGDLCLDLVLSFLVPHLAEEERARV